MKRKALRPKHYATRSTSGLPHPFPAECDLGCHGRGGWRRGRRGLDRISGEATPVTERRQRCQIELPLAVLAYAAAKGLHDKRMTGAPKPYRHYPSRMRVPGPMG